MTSYTVYNIDKMTIGQVKALLNSYRSRIPCFKSDNEIRLYLMEDLKSRNLINDVDILNSGEFQKIYILPLKI